MERALHRLVPPYNGLQRQATPLSITPTTTVCTATHEPSTGTRCTFTGGECFPLYLANDTRTSSPQYALAPDRHPLAPCRHMSGTRWHAAGTRWHPTGAWQTNVIGTRWHPAGTR